MKLALALLAALAFAALPLLTSSNYILGVGLSALIFTVAAAALNLIYGYTGLLSFAQLGFWGIGGYASALTVMTFGGSFWWGVVWAALINAAVAIVVGYPTLRTNRHAFVIVTLTFALLMSHHRDSRLLISLKRIRNQIATRIAFRKFVLQAHEDAFDGRCRSNKLRAVASTFVERIELVRHSQRIQDFIL